MKENPHSNKLQQDYRGVLKNARKLCNDLEWNLSQFFFLPMFVNIIATALQTIIFMMDTKHLAYPNKHLFSIHMNT